MASFVLDRRPKSREGGQARMRSDSHLCKGSLVSSPAFSISPAIQPPSPQCLSTHRFHSNLTIICEAGQCWGMEAQRQEWAQYLGAWLDH